MLSLTGYAELKIHVPKNFSTGEVIHGSCVTSAKDFNHIPAHLAMHQVIITINSDSNGCTLNVPGEVQTEGKHYKKSFTIACNTSGSHHIDCHTNGMHHIHKSIKFQGI